MSISSEEELGSTSDAVVGDVGVENPSIVGDVAVRGAVGDVAVGSAVGDAVGEAAVTSDGNVADPASAKESIGDTGSVPFGDPGSGAVDD